MTKYWEFIGYQCFVCGNCKKVSTQRELEEIAGEEFWKAPCPHCGYREQEADND